MCLAFVFMFLLEAVIDASTIMLVIDALVHVHQYLCVRILHV